jgi:hypothetical protein
VFGFGQAGLSMGELILNKDGIVIKLLRDIEKRILNSNDKIFVGSSAVHIF